jgi:hypothetical protein
MNDVTSIMMVSYRNFCAFKGWPEPVPINDLGENETEEDTTTSSK